MLMSVQGRKSRYVTKLSSCLKFMCSRSPAPALLWVCLVFTQRKRGGRAWCHVSLGRLSWLSVTGLLFVLILGHCTLCNVQCQDRRRDNCPCPLFSPAPGPVRTLQWPSWPILMQNPRHSRDNCQALGTTLTRKKFLQHPSFAFEQCH